nr:hypothetical protein [Pandoravirus aubagnensis]
MADTTSLPSSAIDTHAIHSGAEHRQCSECGARVIVPRGVDWPGVRVRLYHATTATMAGLKCHAASIDAAMPHAIGFFGAALALRAGLALFVCRGHGSMLQSAIDAKPFRPGCGMLALCALSHAISATIRDRQHRGLQVGIAAVIPKAINMGIAVAITSCWLVSSSYAIANHTLMRNRWGFLNKHCRYERGLADGVIICSVAVGAVAVAVTILQSDCALVARACRGLVRVINARTEPNTTPPVDGQADLMPPVPDVHQADSERDALRQPDA